MIPQWKKFTGSKEQIEEMRNAKDGWVCRNSFEDDGCIYHGNPEDYEINLEEYLICQKHPHAEMIARHAMTGRDVYLYNGCGQWVIDDNPVWWRDMKYSFNPEGQ